MSAVKRLVFIVIITFQILSLSKSKPLFLNHTFITSLLAASSGSNQGFDNNPNSENIANVRSKSEKLQTTEEDSFSFPQFDLDTTTTSEAPSLLKKKLEKIVRKIVTVAQIKQAVSGHLRDEGTGFQYPYSPDLDEKDIRVSQEYGQSLKIDLSANTNERNLEESEKKIEPSTLGVFILEVFASLVGLTIGAATQFNHSFAQNNTV